MKPKKGGLGKGLEALFADNSEDTSSVVTLRISELEPNKEQPRKSFNEAALAELADSIKEHGVIQPILVRPMPEGQYQIVAGERRWRASRMAGLSEVPVIIRELTDLGTMEIALIENLQREDLNAIEEALGYKQLIEQFGMTQEKLSQRVGKSRPVITNTMRLLTLPKQVTDYVGEGKLSAGQARALLAIDEQEDVCKIAERIALKGENITVREIESIAKKQKQPVRKPIEKLDIKVDEDDKFFKELELALTEQLGKKTTIHMDKNKGSISVEFYSKSELLELANKLTK